MSDQPIIEDLQQVGVVTPDFDATVRAWVAQGVGPFKCWDWSPPRLYGRTLYGEQGAWTMRLGLALHGDMQVAVIEPQMGDSVYRRFLNARRCGAHHLLGASPGGFEDGLAALEGEGFTVAQSARLDVPLELGPLRLGGAPRMLRDRLNPQLVYLDSQPDLRTTLALARIPSIFSMDGYWDAAVPDTWYPPRSTRFDAHLADTWFDAIDSVGILTRDLAETARAYARRLGIADWRAIGGDANDAEGRTRILRARVGRINLELCEPAADAPELQRRLDRRGEGIAYLGVATSEEPAAVVRRLVGRGASVIVESAAPPFEPRVWLDLGDRLGVWLVLAPSSP